MKSSLASYKWFALALLAWLAPTARGQEDQQTWRNVFEKARLAVNLRVPGVEACRLQGDVRIWTKKDAPSPGKYLFVWTPEGKWREEVVFNGYRRVRIGNGKQFWQVRTPEFENASISDLDELLKVGRSLHVDEGDKLKKIRSEKIEGMDASCVRDTSARGYSETFCFDANSGELLRHAPEKNSNEIPWRVVWQEFSRYQSWGSKNFPRTLRGYNGKQLVIEVQLEEIGSNAQSSPTFFDPTKEATVWGDCAEATPWKIKDRPQPVYPESARARGVQGTVVLYAIIEDDGHISSVRMAHSAGTELDQSAAKAVSHWTYERTDGCKDVTGRTETFIDVIFWLER
jgi:TonB family protein